MIHYTYLYTTVALWTKEILAFFGDIVEFPFKQVNHSCSAIHIMRILLGECDRQERRKN